MVRAVPLYTADCETDPFLYERVPIPFLWGLYDGKKFEHFRTTKEFVSRVIDKHITIYAHNGGKFDYMFLLPYIKETKATIINGRIVCMKLGNAELRDSFAVIPEAQRAWGGKTDIDIKKLEANVREQHMEEIIHYNKNDCIKLWDMMNRFREIGGKKLTIASNALAHAKKLGIDPGKTTHTFDKVMREYYYGGRVECFKPGTHKDIVQIDIHSAYPYAMLHDHAKGGNIDFHNSPNLSGMSREEIQRSFITLTCFSDGAFPVRDEGLKFPHAHREYKVTGWEYLVAKEFDLIHDEKILNVAWSDLKINFAPYVNHWYKLKSETNKIENSVDYIIFKTFLNSLYGKLAQNPARYFDYKILEGGSFLDEENGWQLFTEFEGHEIHRRESLWKHKFESGVQWEKKNLYNNVATGASITGFTRAHLLRAMCTIGRDKIIYCDTDGIVCDGMADISGITFSSRVGDWELEDRSPIGHFAGKKLYGIQTSKIDKKTGLQVNKIASKGCKITYEQIERIINGETISWQNAAPSFSIDGRAKFVKRSIRQTAMVPSI